MKVYLWTAGWGWWLFGIGYKTKWFLGLSIAQNKKQFNVPAPNNGENE
ncbi:MAG: hypothetical protein WC648_04730 [Candidatus Paceibacterota bacterium]|jgi:hypothetical protein